VETPSEVTTARGTLLTSSLVKSIGQIDNDNEFSCWVEYRAVGEDEIIHRSADVKLKKLAASAQSQAGGIWDGERAGNGNFVKVDLLNGIHAFGTTVVRAGTGADSFKAALYVTTASIGAATTAYSATNEVSGTNYAAGGIAVPAWVAPGSTGTTAFTTPGGSLVYTTVTLTTAFDCVLIYNSTQSNKAVSSHTFGAQTITAGTFTLTMPSNDSSNALIRIAWEMGRNLYGDGPLLDPPVSSLGPFTSTSAEALWLGSQYTPIFANDPKAGRIYCVRAGGIMSTGASGTLILIPQYGALGGTTMGTSQTVTVPINMASVPWYLQFDVVFRTIGATGGANGTAIGTGFFVTAGASSAPGAGVSCAFPFGGTSAAVDTTANSGITISKTLSVAGSFTTQYAYGFYRN
jgi:hypothetical protein